MKNNDNLLECQNKNCPSPFFKTINDKFLCFMCYLRELQRERTKK